MKEKCREGCRVSRAALPRLGQRRYGSVLRTPFTTADGRILRGYPAPVKDGGNVARQCLQSSVWSRSCSRKKVYLWCIPRPERRDRGRASSCYTHHWRTGILNRSSIWQKRTRVRPAACPKVPGKRTTARDTPRMGASTVVKVGPRPQDAPVAEGVWPAWAALRCLAR